MNPAEAGVQLAEPAPRPPASAADPAAELAVPRGCPFLIAEEGGWRLDVPSRDHRCAAFAPPAPLAPEKQGRLCLTPEHTSCATYLASVAARQARLGAPPENRTTRWGLARTTMVIEDPGGWRARLVAALLDRRHWPAIPAIVLVTTLFTLALAGFRGGIPEQPVATSSAVPSSPQAVATSSAAPGTAEATPAVTPGPTAPVPSAPASPAPSVAPTAAPSVTTRTYRVKSGDTLSAIASRFGVSIQAIVQLNHLANPNDLSVGQLLLIPS